MQVPPCDSSDLIAIRISGIKDHSPGYISNADNMNIHMYVYIISPHIVINAYGIFRYKRSCRRLNTTQIMLAFLHHRLTISMLAFIIQTVNGIWMPTILITLTPNVGTESIRFNIVNIMVADALVPCFARSSAWRICRFWSYIRKDFNYLCHVNVEEWYKM